MINVNANISSSSTNDKFCCLSIQVNCVLLIVMIKNECTNKTEKLYNNKNENVKEKMKIIEREKGSLSSNFDGQRATLLGCNVSVGADQTWLNR